MEKGKESYKQIFKSTTIVGGAQLINIFIGIIRNKIIAILLGPAGVGVAGIFQTIIELVRNGTGLGINFSGVKSVAENASDPKKVARAILVLRRWEFGTGVVGMLVIAIACSFFSNYSFGSPTYTYSIALVSITLLINAVSSGQLAILQGLRKIKEMAKATLLGSILGTIVSLPLFLWLGVSGIVPSMILTAFCSLAISWFYARKVITSNIRLSISETFKEGLGMARLGFFIVVNGFIATISLYFIRVLIRSHLGMDAVGYFQAVWVISTMYISVLLNSMLADYFPRLTAIKDDKEASNQLINQQLEMTLLVGTPMLITMITFASLAIDVLYSRSFQTAIPVLKWQMMASFFTFISYTIGVIYLSKNKGTYAIVIETLRQGIFIGFVYFGWREFGFDVLGVGFLVANLISLIFSLFFANNLNGFNFSRKNIINILSLGILLSLSLFCSLYCEGALQYALNGLLIIICFTLCLIKLNSLLDIKSLFRKRFSKS